MAAVKKKSRTTPRKPEPRKPQYTNRLNLLLSDDQFERLSARATRERRPLPNLVRYLIDVGLTEPTDD